MPPEHTPVSQSVPWLHVWPTVHAGQPPPQSTSVSAPFSTLSLQVGAWHTLFVHTADWQSAPMMQPSPSAQPGQTPPQSTSVSSWFSIPSVQVPRVHTLGPVPTHVQPGSTTQALLQPSPSSLFPSSQTSLGSTFPSPHQVVPSQSPTQA